MEFVKDLFQKEVTKRILVFLFLVLTFYSVRSLFNLILLTFVFTYLINSLEGYIFKRINKLVRTKEVIITIVIYVILFTSIILILYKYVPIIVMQTSFLGNEIRAINLRDNQSLPWVEKFLFYTFKKIDLSSYTPTIVSYGKVVGTWSMYIFLALILSLFFILEKQKLSRFFLKFNESKLSGLYNYLVFFGKNFLDSFGKVIQAQIIIAFVNTVISGIALWIFGFPQVMALCLMIFIFSLIPVVGVIITLIPLVLIAYKIGGMLKIIYVLVMVGLLHTVTSYIIYPKLMADKTEIPIFLTFVILIIGEHFMGVWGLLLGIPLFIFFMDLLDIKMIKKN